MARLLLFGGGAIALAIGAISWQKERLSHETVFTGKSNPPEASPVCPWREPEKDLKRFFPEAQGYELQTRALSGQRLELTKELGRAPMPDESLLHTYCIHGEQGYLGAVLTRRVKGTHGAIEIVLAADEEGRVRGLRLQRLREPESVAAALENPDWLRSFEGKNKESAWEIGGGLPGVAAEARDSAAAIAEGTRSGLILLACANETRAPLKARHH